MALDIEKFTETETRANQARKLNLLLKALQDALARIEELEGA